MVLKRINVVRLASDQDAFIAAIQAAPFDDAPRLVYADWLQERGDEAKAEYLRTVVRLMHHPENRSDVERCVALAEGLDEEWRRLVGGRFEVTVEGLLLRIMAYAFSSILKMALQESVDAWNSAEPMILKSGLTREDAERLIDTCRQLNPNVRLMSTKSGRGLLDS